MCTTMWGGRPICQGISLGAAGAGFRIPCRWAAPTLNQFVLQGWGVFFRFVLEIKLEFTIIPIRYIELKRIHLNEGHLEDMLE